MASILGAITLTEDNSTSVKNIDGDSVSYDDVCFAVDTNGFYVYMLEYSSKDENVPDVIRPSVNYTNKRWILRNFNRFVDDVQIDKDAILSLTSLKPNDNDGIKFVDRNNREVCKIDENGLVINKNLFLLTGNLDINTINDVNINNFVLADGSVSFNDQMKGIYPQEDDDITTKKYVDDSIDDLSNSVLPRTFEHVAEPSDPDPNFSVLYSSDGSAGDETEGDLVLKINIGGTIHKNIISSY